MDWDPKPERLAETILKANREESQDVAYQEEMSEWDLTLLDGLAPN